MPLHLRIVLLVLLATVRVSDAQPLFDDEAVLDIELSGPLHTLFRNKSAKVREEQPFTLVVAGRQHDIRVRIRGKSRVRVCTFTPLRLNFDPDAVADSVFAGQDKLKLVTHCSAGRFAEDNVLEEYAAYRIFNLLSDRSYRVRLAHIRYTDTDRRVSGLSEPRYGFLIESREGLARRTGGSYTPIPGLSLRRLDQEHAALMYVFQYLVGNTDWSLAAPTGEEICCHNVTPVKIQSLLNPIPYDFDMSGLVNAKYAGPHPDLHQIKRVTQRLYRGYCTDPEILRGAIKLASDNEDEIRQIIDDLPLLEQKTKKQNLDFLDTFFKDAARKDRLFRRFENQCLGKTSGSKP